MTRNNRHKCINKHLRAKTYLGVYVIPHTLYESFFIICCADEGMPFITFVRKSLYPKGNNASKDEGL